MEDLNRRRRGVAATHVGYTGGSSYRSAIFPLNDSQEQIAKDTIADVDAPGLGTPTTK